MRDKLPYPSPPLPPIEAQPLFRKVHPASIAEEDEGDGEEGKEEVSEEAAGSEGGKGEEQGHVLSTRMTVDVSDLQQHRKEPERLQARVSDPSPSLSQSPNSFGEAKSTPDFRGNSACLLKLVYDLIACCLPSQWTHVSSDS